MSEAPREEQPKEQSPTPLVHSLKYGAGTMLAAGMVDLVAHLGPTGLVVGGIIAYAAAKHGPELASRVRETLPAPASPQAFRQRHGALSKSRGSQGTRTFLDRALGRFAAEEEDTVALTRFAGTVLRGPVELDSELAAAPPSPAAGMPPEQHGQLGSLFPSPIRMNQPIAAVQQARPVKAKLSPELEQALQAYRQGATTARGLADALKERGIQCGKDKAAALIRRLRELGELP